MQVNSSTSSSMDLQQAQKQQEMQQQREQAKETLANEQRVQEAAKVTGVGQHLNITA